MSRLPRYHVCPRCTGALDMEEGYVHFHESLLWGVGRLHGIHRLYLCEDCGTEYHQTAKDGFRPMTEEEDDIEDTSLAYGE